jgi:hypothetical protein
MIDPGELQRRIGERAYRIWLDEGQPAGKANEHWERARAEVAEEAAMTEGHHELKGY